MAVTLSGDFAISLVCAMEIYWILSISLGARCMLCIEMLLNGELGGAGGWKEYLAVLIETHSWRRQSIQRCARDSIARPRYIKWVAFASSFLRRWQKDRLQMTIVSIKPTLLGPCQQHPVCIYIFYIYNIILLSVIIPPIHLLRSGRLYNTCPWHIN